MYNNRCFNFFDTYNFLDKNFVKLEEEYRQFVHTSYMGGSVVSSVRDFFPTLEQFFLSRFAVIVYPIFEIEDNSSVFLGIVNENKMFFY